MKKGSKLRKCNACGAGIFWIVPKRNCGIFIECDTKDIRPWLIRDGKYWCKECYEKHTKGKAV